MLTNDVVSFEQLGPDLYCRNSISNAKVPPAERPVSPASTFDRASLNSALTLSSNHGLPVSIQYGCPKVSLDLEW